MVALPLMVIFSGWLQPNNSVWQHLAQTVLADLIINTLVLQAGVAVGVLLLGVGLAWLTTMTEFPGRRWFDWLLMLPLAIPAYVLAFVVLGMFDFAGPLQTQLREWFGSDIRLPQIRSTGGVIIVMTLVLYPYVYMLARSAFLAQSAHTLDAAKILGQNSWGVFFRVSLPMARPAIVAGLSLAMMETLADFGTVAVFNYDTFTTAIYKAWFGLFNLQAASQLASLLLIFVAVALYAERHLRGRAKYHQAQALRDIRLPLKGFRAFFATAVSGLVFFLAFLLPVAQLCAWSYQVVTADLDRRYFELLWHTLALGASATLLTLTGALLLAFAQRYQGKKGDLIIRNSVAVATLGYALPGSVLAVGVMLAVTGVDNALGSLWHAFTGVETGQLLGGTVVALLIAYLVRFLAVAFGPIESGLQRIRPSLADSARSLGANNRRIFLSIYLPLLRPGLLTAALLVLVDVMKEMPATLLLRPFGWDTLSVRIYEMTSEGEWQHAALPAITLILAGLLPVIVLVNRSARPIRESVKQQPLSVNGHTKTQEPM